MDVKTERRKDGVFFWRCRRTYVLKNKKKIMSYLIIFWAQPKSQRNSFNKIFLFLLKSCSLLETNYLKVSYCVYIHKISFVYHIMITQSA